MAMPTLIMAVFPIKTEKVDVQIPEKKSGKKNRLSG